MSLQSLGLTSSETSSWDSLPEPTVPDLPPAEDSPDKPDRPGPGICITCNEAIIREPGARGRMPKYHPDCRPLTTATSNASATRRSNKAEAEASVIVEKFRKAAIKGAVMLAAVDKFDAFCIMVMLPSFCENLHGVLVSHDSWRKTLLQTSAKGSVLGLGIALITGLAPIAAHHKLIPSKQVSEMLISLPSTMHKIQQQLKDGESKLATVMEDQLAEDAARKKPAPDGEI